MSWKVSLVTGEEFTADYRGLQFKEEFVRLHNYDMVGEMYIPNGIIKIVEKVV